jgi:hypothetical protein
MVSEKSTATRMLFTAAIPLDSGGGWADRTRAAATNRAGL